MLMDRTRDTVNRTDGMGLNLIKFHWSLHIADETLNFGPPSNCSAEAGESLRIKSVKKPAKNTQKRVEKHDCQAAARHCERLAIDRATSVCNVRTRVAVVPTDTESSEVMPFGKTCFIHRRLGVFLNRKETGHKEHAPVVWENKKLQILLIEFINKNIFDHLLERAQTLQL